VADQILIGSSQGMFDTAQPHALTIVRGFAAKKYGDDGKAASGYLLISAVRVLRAATNHATLVFGFCIQMPSSNWATVLATGEMKRTE